MTGGPRRSFKCTEMRERYFQHFQDLKNKGEFCDITFRIGDESISAHRIIVTAAIPYFRDALSKNCKAAGEDIQMPNIEPSALKCLIEFAYTCNLEINQDNAVSLLSAACHLRIHEVREACSDFLFYNLDTENALDIREVAHNLHCAELVESIDEYVKENFNQICQKQEFLKCSITYLKDIIGQNDLIVDREENVLEAVVRWVKESLEDRMAALPGILTKIRMSQIEPQYLAELVEREQCIRTSILCRDIVDEARNYNLWPQMRKCVCSFPTEPRQSNVSSVFQNMDKEAIYKFNGELRLTVQRFDLMEEKWQTKDSSQYNTNGGSAAELNKKLYFFEWDNSIEYDLAGGHYEFLASVPTPRCYVAVTSFRERLFLFGGRKGSYGDVGFVASDAVECFYPAKDEWTEKDPMTTARWGISAVTLGEHIFVLGGQNESSAFDCAEKYNPVKDKWRKLSPMLNKRSHAGVAIQNCRIYVCGGLPDAYTGDHIATAEVYDPVENNWKLISPMNSARYEFTLLSCGSKLYALGGKDENEKQLHAFDVYDPRNDTWTVGVSTDSGFKTSAAVVI